MIFWLSLHSNFANISMGNHLVDFPPSESKTGHRLRGPLARIHPAYPRPQSAPFLGGSGKPPEPAGSCLTNPNGTRNQRRPLPTPIPWNHKPCRGDPIVTCPEETSANRRSPSHPSRPEPKLSACAWQAWSSFRDLCLTPRTVLCSRGHGSKARNCSEHSNPHINRF